MDVQQDESSGLCLSVSRPVSGLLQRCPTIFGILVRVQVHVHVHVHGYGLRLLVEFAQFCVWSTCVRDLLFLGTSTDVQRNRGDPRRGGENKVEASYRSAGSLSTIHPHGVRNEEIKKKKEKLQDKKKREAIRVAYSGLWTDCRPAAGIDGSTGRAGGRLDTGGRRVGDWMNVVNGLRSTGGRMAG